MITVRKELWGFREGDKVGQRILLGPAFSLGNRWAFVAKCSCGQISLVDPTNLKKGVKSCKSCSKIQHGESDTRLFSIFTDMKTRCYNENRDCYKNYGGRGITVCEEWLNNPTAFFLWARSNGYRDDLEIDREDNDLGYSPTNCRWVTPLVQNNNKRNILKEKRMGIVSA